MERGTKYARGLCLGLGLSAWITFLSPEELNTLTGGQFAERPYKATVGESGRLTARTSKKSRALKIVDKSSGYYVKEGRVVAPVSVYDFSFGPGGEDFPAVDFKHVVDKGECYGICIQRIGQIGYSDCGRPGDTIPFRLTGEEYRKLKEGKKLNVTIKGLVPVEGDDRKLKEAWEYPVCFESE